MEPWLLLEEPNMDLSWPQLSGYVTWSGSQDQHDELCQVNGEGAQETRKKGLVLLSNRPQVELVISLVSWASCGKQAETEW